MNPTKSENPRTDSELFLRMEKYCSNLLTFNPEVLGVLNKLGFTSETISKFNIGCDNDPASEMFNRITFPISDATGEIVGFCGRTITQGEYPVYRVEIISSLESWPLFGINHAVVSNAEYFLLCEGVLDTILLYQNGFDSAVAVLGTKLKENNAQYLAGLKKHVIIFYDNDSLGKKCAQRDAELLENYGVTVDILKSSDLDPASQMRRPNGKESLQQQIDELCRSRSPQ